LQVGGWTTLVVLFRGKPRSDLIAFITDKLSRLIEFAHIKKSVIEVFANEVDLEKKLTEHVNRALGNLKS
jgi:hypothetical protein